MDLKIIKADGPTLSAGQQAAFYQARKRRAARARAGAAEFNARGTMQGFVLIVVLTAQ